MNSDIQQQTDQLIKGLAHWLENEFDQVERIQVAIVNQQSEIKAMLEDVNIKSTMLWAKIKHLQSVVSESGVSPELEKQILRSQKLSRSIDAKVPDKE